jgi:NitT/TauT family transport system substrate-binding protein
MGDESQHHPDSTSTGASAHTGVSRQTLLKILWGASGVWLASACAAPPAGSTPATAAPAAAPTTAPAVAPTVAPGVVTPLTKVLISYSEDGVTDLAVYLAKDKGLFEQQGLDANLTFIASNTGIAALLSNQTQFALIGAPEILGAAVGGGDTLAFIQLSGAPPYLMEVQKDIHTIDDLKGKKIGVSSFGSSSDSATRQSLKLQGIDPDKDVSLVTVGSTPNRNAALLAGGIDAGLAGPPDNLVLEDGGLHSLYDCSTLSGMLPLAQTLSTRKATIAQNRDLVQRVANAVVAGTVLEKNNREVSEQVLAHWTGDDPSYANQRAMDVAWDYWTSRILRIPPTPKLSEWQGFVDQLTNANAKAQGFDPSTVIDTSFVDAAVAQGFAN